MKGYDAIKYLLDNKTHKLTTVIDNVKYKMSRTTYDVIYIYNVNEGSVGFTVQLMQSDWTIEPQEITRDEALQRLADRKKVKHVFDSLEDAKCFIKECSYQSIVETIPIQRLIKGKWYAID